MLPLDKRRQIKERYQKDPALFCKDVFGGRLWGKQVEVMESVRDHGHTYVKSSHGVGKTYMAAKLAIWFKTCFRPSKVITLAPSWTQVASQLWGEIRKAHKTSKVPLGGLMLQTEWKCDEDEYMLGVSPEEEVNLQGHHQTHILVIFDEAPGISPPFWEAKEGLLSAGKLTRFLAIGNPTESSGPFYEAWTKNRGNRITMNTFDSPNFKLNGINTLDDLKGLSIEDCKAMPKHWEELINPEWARERLEQWGAESHPFMSRVLGEFPLQGDDTLIPMDTIKASVNVVPNEGSPHTLGVDVARYGSDKTAFIGFHDWSQDYNKTTSGQSLTETAGRIVDLVKTKQYDLVVIDDGGLGGGVTDIMQEWARNNPSIRLSILPVNFGEKPTKGYLDEPDPEVQDRGTQMWVNARDKLREGRVRLIDEGALFHQLAGRKYGFQSSGKMKLQSKEELRKKGFPSPDESDACVLAIWGMTRALSSRIGLKDLEESLAFGSDRASASAPWEG